MQITGDSYQPIDSEVDPDDSLSGVGIGMDMRGHDSRANGIERAGLLGKSSHKTSHSRSSLDSATDLMDHRHSIATSSNRLPTKKKNSVARWIDSSSRPNRRHYTAIGTEEAGDDDDVLAIDINELRRNTTNDFNNLHADDDSVFGTTTNTNANQFRIGSPESVESAPNSKPSTRRGSSSSSLNDVCYPIDSPHEIDSTMGDTKMWPDLNVLNEFAEEEMKDYVGLARHSVEGDDSGDRATSPFMLGGDAGRSGSVSGLSSHIPHGRYSVNEVNLEDPGARLRPQRIVPWNGRDNQQQQPRSYSIPGVDEKNALDYRFTYFREDMDATIHSPTISGLLQPNQTFASLFPPKLYTRYPEDMRATPEDTISDQGATRRAMPVPTGAAPMQSSTGSMQGENEQVSGAAGANGRRASASPAPEPVPFWLDIMNPTEEEMKVLSKAFGIHPLTTEDIFLGETREKVELFRNYYLVCFRSIDTNVGRDQTSSSVMNAAGNPTTPSSTGVAASQGGVSGLIRRTVSTSSGQSFKPKTLSKTKSHRRHHNELRPLNMYIVVFHEGVLTFHFAPTLHTINVRRRARLLRDYITVSSDWISYALIDDITDAFAPMIDAIEEEVNSIEDEILNMHSGSDDCASDSDSDDGGFFDERKSATVSTSSHSSRMSSSQKWKRKGDMLRTIGESRKRVMSLLRLLGSKADVIKGFAKRCNERWEVAPRNEIGLYLGDIQDHIVTMVQSLNHYEKLLARSHSNYLAQINIDMTKVNNDTNDVLGRITILGTIVLPMNIVTGLWGMNVLVPGQGREDLIWFWGIVVLLLLFVVCSYYVARRVYKI